MVDIMAYGVWEVPVWLDLMIFPLSAAYSLEASGINLNLILIQGSGLRAFYNGNYSCPPSRPIVSFVTKSARIGKTSKVRNFFTSSTLLHHIKMLFIVSEKQLERMETLLL